METALLAGEKEPAEGNEPKQDDAGTETPENAFLRGVRGRAASRVPRPSGKDGENDQDREKGNLEERVHGAP